MRRDKYRYGEKWAVERSAVKRIFGEEIRATSIEGAMQETAIHVLRYAHKDKLKQIGFRLLVRCRAIQLFDAADYGAFTIVHGSKIRRAY